MSESTVSKDVMVQMITNEGDDLLKLSGKSPIMLIFLRHFGCMFCREALSDIAKQRAEIEAMGTRILFVHMSDRETAETFFTRYGLTGAAHISDPDCRFYAAFGLTKGNFNQLFGLRSWIRGFQTAVVQGHGLAPPVGDGFQMPGVFVIHKGIIQESYIHKLSSDRPDYEHLVRSCCAIS